MNYTVLWTAEAKRTLAALWVDNADRNAITAAAREIDQRLVDSPEEEGESRSNDRRIMFVSPLGISFKVYPRERIVYVLTLWRFGRPT